jgi:ubiquinone/menaquinone biosynthesis C-methylase UbiE
VIWAPFGGPNARDLFARVAETYDGDNPLLAMERPATEPLLPDFEGRDVLDVGAGHGHYARLAASRGAGCVLALDVNAGMLQGLPVRAVAADAAALPLAAARFDVVIAALVTSYVDRARTLSEIARVLRPDGVLVLSELHARGAALGWQRTFRDPIGRTIVIEAPPPDPDVLRREIEGAGFTVDVLKETCIDARLAPHFRRAGRRDLPSLLGVPLLVHIAARKGRS